MRLRRASTGLLAATCIMAPALAADAFTDAMQTANMPYT
jgi:hypothetical protein